MYIRVRYNRFLKGDDKKVFCGQTTGGGGWEEQVGTTFCQKQNVH